MEFNWQILINIALGLLGVVCTARGAALQNTVQQIAKDAKTIKAEVKANGDNHKS